VRGALVPPHVDAAAACRVVRARPTAAWILRVPAGGGCLGVQTLKSVIITPPCIFCMENY
jgi:hypothetical protein